MNYPTGETNSAPDPQQQLRLIVKTVLEEADATPELQLSALMAFDEAAAKPGAADVMPLIAAISMIVAENVFYRRSFETLKSDGLSLVGKISGLLHATSDDALPNTTVAELRSNIKALQDVFSE